MLLVRSGTYYFIMILIHSFLAIKIALSSKTWKMPCVRTRMHTHSTRRVGLDRSVVPFVDQTGPGTSPCVSCHGFRRRWVLVPVGRGAGRPLPVESEVCFCVPRSMNLTGLDSLPPARVYFFPKDLPSQTLHEIFEELCHFICYTRYHC